MQRHEKILVLNAIAENVIYRMLCKIVLSEPPGIRGMPNAL